MADVDKPTIARILEEFGSDPAALAAEVLALRRALEELRVSLRDEPPGPIVIVAPPERPPAHEPAPDPPPGWYPPPRAESA